MLECNAANLLPATPLDPWDSLSVVSMIAVIDDVYNISVSGKDLLACVTVADVMALVPHDA